MSTRGLVGFRKRGIDKCGYNNSDSYPNWLGKAVLQFCCDYPLSKMEEMYDGIIMVAGHEKPTAEDRRVVGDYLERPDYIDDDEKDWYDILHTFQGNLGELYNFMAQNNGIGYMPDAWDFIMDSLFCEYGYIINLDTGMLEYWKGFQKEPDSDNRYGCEANSSGYYPCKLMLEIPLSRIYGDADIIPEIIFRMNEESCMELIDLANKHDWSIKLPDVSGELPCTLVDLPCRYADFWSDSYGDLVYSVAYDGTQYDLKKKIIEKLNEFDPDEYAYQLVSESMNHDVESMRYACDIAENINKQCADLIQVIKASMYC